MRVLFEPAKKRDSPLFVLAKNAVDYRIVIRHKSVVMIPRGIKNNARLHSDAALPNLDSADSRKKTRRQRKTNDRESLNYFTNIHTEKRGRQV